MRRGDSERSSSLKNGWSTTEEISPLMETTNGRRSTGSSGEWPLPPPIPTNSNNRPVPGRPRKRMPVVVPTPPGSGGLPPGKSTRKKTFCQRFQAKWIPTQKSSRGIAKQHHQEGFSLAVLVAIVLWYLLGVMSIGTSKLLLMKPRKHGLVGNVPPLFLTLQQLALASWFFRFLLERKALGSKGIQPWPTASAVNPRSSSSRGKMTSRQQNTGNKSPELVLAGLFFGLGFLTTNYSFRQTSAAFVETVKAAEPITSAAIATSWGIETLGTQEVLSLATIVTGVLTSTVANGSEAASPQSSSSGVSASVSTCLLVMVTNLCFSFRGLHQKLFRASPNGASSVVDDLNLQYRMQQVGVAVFIIPVLLFDGLDIISRIWHLHWTHGLLNSGALLKYVGLSLMNGFAFASYNLASTFILTRISVVHHAALNCIRRIFAIIVTSIMFGIPITWLGAFGMLMSFVGFMSFTHYKVKRQRQPRPLSSLLPMSAV